MNNAIKLKIKNSILNEWDDGFYNYESWRKISVKIENYFKQKNFKTYLYTITTTPPLHILTLEWELTKTYEDYFK